MNFFVRFLFDFMSQFFDGLITVFRGIADGFVKMFDFNSYATIMG